MRVLGTTALVRPGRVSPYRMLEQAGYNPKILPAKSGGRIRPELSYQHEAASCRVIDVGASGTAAWEKEWGHLFDSVLDRELREFQPHIVVVPDEGVNPKRCARAKAKGAKLVLTVSRVQSVEETSLYDAAICQSQWLADNWRGPATLKPAALPPPIPPREVISEQREPLCVTLPFPTIDGGVFLLLRLAEQLSLADAECPILVLTSMGAEATGRGLIEAGRAAGFDLTQYSNIMMADPSAQPKEIWAAAQVFVAPSLAHPPAVLMAEAMTNGVPVIAGDRADVKDIVGCSGFTLPLPIDYGPNTRAPLPAAAIEEWTELIARITRDEAFYAAESEKARKAAEAFNPQSLAPRYSEFFERVAGSE